MACRLVRRGYAVLVLEKQHQVGKASCCTGIIGKECADFISPPNSVIYREARSARFVAPSGDSLQVAKDTVQAYIVDRRAFDQALAAQAQQQGAEYLLGNRVKEVLPQGKEAVVKTEEASFRAQAVVLAGGLGCALPQQLGLGKIADFVLGAQAEVESSVEEVEVYLGQRLAPGFFAWLVPTASGKALAGLLSRRSPDFYLKSFLHTLFQQGRIASAEVKISFGAIPLRPLPRTYREKMIVVGDAAGQVKPTTGGGIYYGLLAAEVGARILEEAFLHQDFSARQMSRYEKEWRKKLGRELRLCSYARRIYEKLDDRNIEEIFHLIHSNSIHQALLQSREFSFDWHSGLIWKTFQHQAVRGTLQVIKTLPLMFRRRASGDGFPPHIADSELEDKPAPASYGN